VARNVASRFAEIDIIARHGEYLVFVEVKGRKDDKHGSGFEAVTYRKRLKIVSEARLYAAQRGLSETPIRFDVVAVEWGASGEPKVDHIAGAFDSEGA
jgi:putative endonuclease